MKNTITNSCFYKFNDLIDDKNSICYRIKDLSINNTIKNINYNNYLKQKIIQKDEIKSLYRDFIFKFNEYDGNLYYSINTMLKCLDIVMIKESKYQYYNDFKIFVDIWNNESDNLKIRLYKLQHKIISILRKIYKNEKHYLSELLMKDIQNIHLYNQENNVYQNIKEFFTKNNINYNVSNNDITTNTTDNTTDNTNNNTLESSNDGWEQVSDKKNKKKQNLHSSNNNKVNTNIINNSDISNNNNYTNDVESIIDDNEMKKIVNYNITNNENYLNQYNIDINQLEIDTDFIEDVYSEPDTDDTYTSDEDLGNEY